MITKGSFRGLHIFFNGVKRNNKASVVMHKKSAPSGHALDTVVFKLSTFLKKETNVVSKWTIWTDWETRVTKRTEPINLWPSLPLLASFKDWN